MDPNTFNQRDAYKLVEGLATGQFKNEISLLESLIKDVVDHGNFNIVGGRIWELDAEEELYRLRYQHGNLKKIPEGYFVPIKKQPIFKKLKAQRTILNVETDKVLLDTGIEFFSITGVGELVKLPSGTYFKYAIGFNAPEILQSFYETLAIISSVASIALINLSTNAEKLKINKDLERASEIQRNLLPEHKLEFHDYKIFGVCIPDSKVGGDYFDYLKSPVGQEERLGIVVCDAASKGLPAAIQALFVSGAIRMGVGFSTRISNLINRLNTLIYDTFPSERFVTLFFCELTLSSNRLVLYSNAGHCPPMHYCPESDSIKYLDATGGLLGLMQNQKIEVENTTMCPGDIILIYTDGITEARNSKNEFFGEKRIAEVIKKHHKESSKTIAYSLLEEVQNFSANSQINDDKTIVVIKRDPK
ncbi:MAG: PP2C family protein-serine/threonine phosphatase [Ignavibacteria bacterium]|jgi:sigma-B regulation protein RsbU (phosphoserine phosphatase)|nr:PP2C family protein-serine/threonine phosphatase [Ignavibacteria bacterium]